MQQQQQHQQQQRSLCSFSLGRCAVCGVAVSTVQSTMRLSITSTTGSPLELIVPRGETVEGLKTRISQKLRLPTDRIVLLYNEKQLTTGKLLDLGVADDSKVTLVPVIEAGLSSTNRAEKSLMDVLERLTDDQIRDFLSGHSPLTINLGMGAHRMHVELKLSAQRVKELQQDRDVRVKNSSKHKTGLLIPGSLSYPDSDSTCLSNNLPGSTTSPTPQTFPPALNTADATCPGQPGIQRPTTFNLTSHSSSSVPAAKCHQSPLHRSCALQSSHTSSPVLSTSFCPSACPVQATTPVCSSASRGSSPGPLSPTPASTFAKNEVLDTYSTGEMCEQPGAVIESLVSHSPGIFCGTFSGTLAPCKQSSISHPREGISVILQILSDLLRAASNHHSPTLSIPVNSVLTAMDTSRERSQLQVTQRVEHCNKSPEEDRNSLPSSTEENQALHCKLEHLQFLMHQRNLRRQTYRSSHLSQKSYPYQRRQHRP